MNLRATEQPLTWHPDLVHCGGWVGTANFCCLSPFMVLHVHVYVVLGIALVSNTFGCLLDAMFAKWTHYFTCFKQAKV